MKTKRLVKLAALLLSVAIIGVAFGVILNQRLLSMNGGISSTGAIQLYSDATCTTVLTSGAIPKWLGTETPPLGKSFAVWVKATGNSLLYLKWDAAAPWVLRATPTSYEYINGGVTFRLSVKFANGTLFNPKGASVMSQGMAPNAVEALTVYLEWFAGNAAVDLNWNMVFYAEDVVG